MTNPTLVTNIDSWFFRVMFSGNQQPGNYTSNENEDKNKNDIHWAILSMV
jgi:hypothetical protein